MKKASKRLLTLRDQNAIEVELPIGALKPVTQKALGFTNAAPFDVDTTQGILDLTQLPIASAIDEMPPIAELTRAENLQAKLDAIPNLEGALSWVFSHHGGFVVSVPESMCIRAAQTPHQFLIANMSVIRSHRANAF